MVNHVANQKEMINPIGPSIISAKSIKKKSSLSRLLSSARKASSSKSNVSSIPSSPSVPQSSDTSLDSLEPTAPKKAKTADVTSAAGPNEGKGGPQEDMDTVDGNVGGRAAESKNGTYLDAELSGDWLSAIDPQTPLVRSKSQSSNSKHSRILHHVPTLRLAAQKQRSASSPLEYQAFDRGPDVPAIPYDYRTRDSKSVQSLRPSTANGVSSMSKSEASWRDNHVIAPLDFTYASVSAHELSHGTRSSAWPTRSDNDEIRESYRSALTSNMSITNTSTTERSSVFTKCTSVGGVTYDGIRETSIDGGMTVDDAIGMYAAGFADDVEDGPTNPKISTSSEEVRRRSVKLAEAMNENMDVRPPSLLSPTFSPEIRTSAAIISGVIPMDASVELPIITPTTPTRDQYGFKKLSHHISIAQFDAWNAEYAPIQKRRNGKWATLMRHYDLSIDRPTRFPEPSAKIQRFIRKGIPPIWRGSAWFFYAGGDLLLHKHPGVYVSLVSRSHSELNSNDKDTIERDLHRTFPDNIRFKGESGSTSSSLSLLIELPLLSSLRLVLRAFALHHPRIGYCQSLNFIAGLLLLFLPEEKAFWMLHIIVTRYLPGTHEVSLEGANVDLWVLMVALKESIPGIWAKVGATTDDNSPGPPRLPPISLCTTSWFMSLFIGTLPIESVLRVWDVLFYEGSRTLFRVALAIFKVGEQRIKEVHDQMEIFQVVQALPRGMLDVKDLLSVACKRGGVSQDWLERRRTERKLWYSKHRSKLSAGENNISAGAADGSSSARRPSVSWKRRMGIGK